MDQNAQSKHRIRNLNLALTLFAIGLGSALLIEAPSITGNVIGAGSGASYAVAILFGLGIIGLFLFTTKRED